MNRIASMPRPYLFPGFRFHPTDEELIVCYMKKKVASPSNAPLSIIANIDLHKFNPWELPDSRIRYWKSTGTDKSILNSGGLQRIGIKKALIFYEGKPPKGMKTEWVMQSQASGIYEGPWDEEAIPPTRDASFKLKRTIFLVENFRCHQARGSRLHLLATTWRTPAFFKSVTLQTLLEVLAGLTPWRAQMGLEPPTLSVSEMGIEFLECTSLLLLRVVEI
ncbi:unnamed protein product [Thlaspi arvense]|uniref:NAC domain-containing protein n=1 Tax=Thlaspi arvense TaxID=13288 RepID=A0AAU9SGD9_THLAR|nr:unnamed protein product [Thlaspi arvense]